MDFQKLQAEALKAGIKEIEVYAEKQKGISIETFNGEVEGNTSYDTNVLAVRGVYEGQIVTIYEEQDDDSMIPSIIERIVDNCKINNQHDPFFIYGGSKEYPSIVLKDHDYDNYSLEAKTNLCLNLTKAIQSKSSFVTKVETSYSEENTSVSIQNSNGLNVSRNSKLAYIVASVVCQKDNDIKSGFDFAILNNIKEANLEEIATKVVEKTTAKFGAESMDSGSYPVVFDRSVVRSLLAAFQNVFSANAVLKNMSFLKDKVGEQVFGININLVDDPLYKDNPYAFDDEGVACQTKKVVEAGVLKTYLHNLKTAAMMKTTSTGNGFKAGVQANVDVACANLYLQNGDTPLDAVFAKIKNGVYITDVSGLHAGLNPVSGAFNLQSSGYLIENGVKSRPVTLIIVSGSFQEMLNNVTMIADDFEYKNGFGAPSIAIKSLAISGK